MTVIDQNYRLRVAAHIKAIGDAPDGFEAWRADEIAEMLAPMPVEGSRFKFLASRSGSSSEGVAAGVGNVQMAEDEQKHECRTNHQGDQERSDAENLEADIEPHQRSPPLTPV